MNYKKVRECVKRSLFSTPNLRTHENIRKQRKIGYKTRFVYFGSAYCAIHELMKYMIYCSLGKK